MGCVSSKQAVSVTPALDLSGGFAGGDNSGRIRTGSGCEERNGGGGGGTSGRINNGRSSNRKSKGEFGSVVSCGGSEVGESGRASSNGDSLSFRLGNLHKYINIEGEQVAAGWPAWLSAVAGEAIQGWVPLRADSYEKLEKIGQGTYSSVFRARDLDTGKIVALKKVRFDNFEPESVRFMAREIMILRRLDHPNIIKLEGLITSRLSCSIYLVFEYMEHDITGLLSCPDIKFSESQIKCYMKQLLSGLEHCHSRGVMHRDIKGSNLLVSNEGILKVADFGLANFSTTSSNRQPLTSRVVTLWYRPPELLLGSTDYGVSVDLWSVGCVFAELITGKPILQGRTEVEQLHKIFKLCGSPPEDYWKKSKLPHATLFKPQQPYDSCLRETFKDLPTNVVNLIQTLLSVEPYKRGTASAALKSEFFTTKPYACDPSSLPVYPPNKEIDAKHREDARRKKSGRSRGGETRKPTRKLNGMSKLLSVENVVSQNHADRKSNVNTVQVLKENAVSVGDVSKPLDSEREEASHVKNASHGDIPFSGPLQVSTSSGFAWARRRKDDASARSHSRSISRGHIANVLEPSTALNTRTGSRKYDNGDDNNNNSSNNNNNNDSRIGIRSTSRGHDSYEGAKLAMLKQLSQFERPESFDASDGYHSQELSLALYQREEMASKMNNPGYQDQGDKVEFSGPLLSQSHRIDELLEKNERHIRQAVRKSWFQRGKKHWK